MIKVVISPDSFKGTLTAREAAEAMALGLRDADREIQTVILPVGDGGEGTAEAIASTMCNAKKRECLTVDALGRPITASYYILNNDTALIETAAASGLTLLRPEERDILKADSTGTGLLIADAVGRGIRKFIIGMGGTATCDGGYGAFQVLDNIGFKPDEIRLLCDVENPLCGPKGAAAVYGPQKGATPEMIPILEKRLKERAMYYQTLHGIDTSYERYAGAAGGMAAMFIACFNAKALSGIEETLRLLNFERHIEGASLVITGEGRADMTTLAGKAPKGVLDAARRRGIPVALIAGAIADREVLLKAGFIYAENATPPDAKGELLAATHLRRKTNYVFSQFIGTF